MDKQDDYSDEFDAEEEEEVEKPRKMVKPKRADASPRPKSTTKKKLQTAYSSKGAGSPRRSRPTSAPGRSVQQMWLKSVKSGTVNASKPRGPATVKRTATEYWNNTLRRTGSGMSTECSGMEAGGKRGARTAPFSSTSHYLRQMVGVEKSQHSMSEFNNTGKTTPGRPAYKDPEEYYDEILSLKKQMTTITRDNSTLKSKIRRLQEDNLKKEKEIEQLLDPSKSDDIRRTLTDRRPDTGTVMHGLKQKILKLEHQLKDKEAALSKLQSDLKTTKIEEMKLQMEQFYKEVLRLNQLKSVPSNGPSKPLPKESGGKMKALQETVLRMNEKNLRLTAENKAIKQDLQKLMDEKDATKERQKDYGDMSKKDLLGVVGKLEKRLDRAENEAVSVVSDVEKRQEKEGKISLEGSLADKLSQLDARETELLEELEKQRGIIKRLKEDRAHYRKRCDQRDKELKTVKKERDELQEELDQFYEKDKMARSSGRVTPRSDKASSAARVAASSRKRTSPPRNLSRSSSVSSLEREKLRRVEDFRQQTAARHIQREWRQHRGRERELEEHRHNIEEFSKKHAAKRIQRGWKEKQQLGDATELIQSALRGHQTRQFRLRSFDRARDDGGATDNALDDAADLIQASLRGHQYRKQKLRTRHGSPRRHGVFEQRKRLDSAGEDEESDYHSTPFHRHSPHSSMKQTPRSSIRSGKFRRSHEDEDDDDDDSNNSDIIVVRGR